MHIVALPGWYPVKNNLLNGDFIQRHLQAISLECRVTLLYGTFSDTASSINIEKNSLNKLEEIRIYLPKKSEHALARLLSFFTYYKMMRKEIIKIGKADLLHVHVVKKNGVFALINKIFNNQRYVITEHSTEYIDGQWESYSFLKRTILKAVFKHASAVHCVSGFLASALKEKLNYKHDIKIIPNVVNTDLFYPSSTEKSYVSRFIHISTLTAQKNIDEIVLAFSLLKRKGFLFSFTIIGPVSEQLQNSLAKNKIKEEVILLNEMPQQQLAQYIRQSDALILYSKYETFGCVLIEAMACGKPVIVSNLPVFNEFVREKESGIFADVSNTNDLVLTLQKFIEGHYIFDHEQIRHYAMCNFSYQVIGRQFIAWYHSILSNSNHE